MGANRSGPSRCYPAAWDRRSSRRSKPSVPACPGEVYLVLQHVALGNKNLPVTELFVEMKIAAALGDAPGHGQQTGALCRDTVGLLLRLRRGNSPIPAPTNASLFFIACLSYRVGICFFPRAGKEGGNQEVGGGAGEPHDCRTTNSQSIRISRGGMLRCAMRCCKTSTAK